MILPEQFKKRFSPALTATGGLFADERIEPSGNKQRSATAAVSRVDVDCLDRAVSGAGAAFHAAVRVEDLRFFLCEGENSMRADSDTLTTTNTGLAVKFENGCSVDVSEVFHLQKLLGLKKCASHPADQRQNGSSCLERQASAHLAADPGK